VRHDYVASQLVRIDQADVARVASIFENLRAQGEAELLAEGFAPEQLDYEFSFDLRYVGQGYDLTVAIPQIPRGADELAETRARFDQEHAQLTGHSAPDEHVEIVNYRMTAVAKVPQASIASPFTHTTDLAGARLGERTTYLGGKATRTTLYDRTKLAPGAVVHGPAILMQGDSTTLVGPGHEAHVVSLGQIEIRTGVPSTRAALEYAGSA
jgi:N-methylhydantoinase A